MPVPGGKEGSGWLGGPEAGALVVTPFGVETAREVGRLEAVEVRLEVGVGRPEEAGVTGESRSGFGGRVLATGMEGRGPLGGALGGLREGLGGLGSEVMAMA